MALADLEMRYRCVNFWVTMPDGPNAARHNLMAAPYIRHSERYPSLAVGGYDRPLQPAHRCCVHDSALPRKRYTITDFDTVVQPERNRQQKARERGHGPTCLENLNWFTPKIDKENQYSSQLPVLPMRKPAVSLQLKRMGCHAWPAGATSHDDSKIASRGPPCDRSELGINFATMPCLI